MANENDVQFTASVKDNASPAIKKLADINEALASSADKASTSVDKLEAAKQAATEAFSRSAKANEEANQAQQEAAELAAKAANATTDVEQAQLEAAAASEKAAEATNKAEQAHEQAVKSADKYSAAQKKMTSGAGLLEQALSRVKKGFALDVVIGNLITGALSGAISAFKELGKAVVDIVYEFAKGEMVMARLETSLRNQGITSRYVVEDLNNYAKSLRSISGLDDDIIKDGMRLFINFGLLGDELKRATASAYNLSVGMGMDLNSAFQLVAKASEGNVSMLSRYGISVDRSKSKSQQFASALDQIDQKFSAVAGANAENLITKTKVLKEEWQEFKENTLKALEPLLSRLISKGNSFVSSLSFMQSRTDEQKKYEKLLKQEINLKARLKNEEALPYGSKFRVAELKEEIASVQEQIRVIDEANYEKLRQAKIDSEAAKKQVQAAQERIKAERKAAAENEKLEKARVKAAEERERRINDFAVNLRKERYDNISAVVSEETEVSQAEMIAAQEKEYQAQLAAMDARISLLDVGNEADLEKMSELQEEKNILREEFDAYNQEIDALQADEKIAASDADIERARKASEIKMKFASVEWSTIKNGLSDLATFQNAKTKALAAVGKAAAIANAIMTTYQAANLALATVPPPWGYVQAAISTAMGLANVAQISGVQLAVGTPNVPEDMPATVHQGEIIVPRTFAEGLRSGELALGVPDVFNSQTDNSRKEMSAITNVQVVFNGDVLSDNSDSLAQRLGEKIGEQIAGGRMAPLPTGERM